MTEQAPRDTDNQPDTIISPETDQKDLGQGTTVESLAKEVSNFKSEISGMSRKLNETLQEKSELESKLKKVELDSLGEKDRAAKELEDAKKEKEEIEAETVILKRSRIIDKALDNAGLPLDFAKRIIGDDETAILEDVKAFNDHIEKHINDGIDAGIKKRLSGEPPESGETIDKGGLDKQIEDAQKAGDFVKVMALKEQKKNLKEV